MSRDKSVGIATAYGLGGLFRLPIRVKDFLFSTLSRPGPGFYFYLIPEACVNNESAGCVTVWNSHLLHPS
jgi:hypothetical protein